MSPPFFSYTVPIFFLPYPSPIPTITCLSRLLFSLSCSLPLSLNLSCWKEWSQDRRIDNNCDFDLKKNSRSGLTKTSPVLILKFPFIIRLESKINNVNGLLLAGLWLCSWPALQITELRRVWTVWLLVPRPVLCLHWLMDRYSKN